MNKESHLSANLADLVMQCLRAGMPINTLVGHLERQAEVLRLVQPYVTAMRDSEVAP